MNICGAEFDPDELEKEMDGDDGMHNPNLCGVNETDADTDQFTTDDDEDDSDTPLAGGPLAVLESAVRKSVKSDSLGNSFATNRPSTKRPKSPKATLQTAASYSGRTYQESPPAGFEGSMSSPTLLNAMSGSEWLTKSYTAPDLHCPSMDSQSSFDRLVNHLETGFRVRLFEEGSSKRSQTFTLFLDVAHNKLCLKRTSEEKADRKVIHEIPLGKILRFETGGASTEVFPSKSFTIVVNQEASIRYFDIKAESSIDREIILSSLTVFLEDYKVKKGKELTEIIDVDEYKEGGTSEQPILCTLSLEQQDSTEEQSESYLTPGHHSQNFKKSQSECDGSLVIHLEDVLSNQESFSLTTIDEDRVDADTPRSSRNATVGRSRSPTGFSKIRGKFTQPVSPYSHTAGRRSPPANHSSPPRPEHRGARSDAVLPPLAEDTILELAASGQLTSNWCAEEMCSFALKDITETCTGIFEPKNSEVGCINPASLDVQQRTLEEYIASALGAPSAFYSYWTEKVRPNSAELKTDEKVRAVPNGRVRNRASVLNAQAARLNKLKGEMTFASALKKSKKMNNVQTVKSFDDSNIICSKRVRATNKAADKFHSSALLNQVVGSMLMGGADTSIGEVAYYDSDPEDVRARTLRTRGPRQVEAELKQAKSTEGDKANPIVLFTGFETVKSTKRVSKKLDEDSIVQMVQVRNVAFDFHTIQDFLPTM